MTWNPSFAFISCVILGNSINLSEPQIPLLYNTHLRGLAQGLSEILLVTILSKLSM